MITAPGIYDLPAAAYHADGMRRFLLAHAGLDGCWIWSGWTDRDGYGRTKVDGVTTIAHRVAYVLTFGPIEDATLVLHRCDNPPCCNPSHLFLGTPKTNAADAKAKDRHSRGERNGCSKLTAGQVFAIRGDHRRQVDIAVDYNISQATVSAIKLGIRWSHL